MKYLLMAFLMVGCTKGAISTDKTNNDEFKVDFLFEKDACKIYRFRDNGRDHYFTSCGETVSGYTSNCGKSCTKWNPENIK